MESQEADNQHQHQMTATPDPAEAPDFNDLVAQLLMGIEELRRSLKGPHMQQQQQQQQPLQLGDLFGFVSHLEALAPGLEQLGRWVMDLGDVLQPEHSVPVDMFKHVQAKLIQAAFATLQTMTTGFSEANIDIAANQNNTQQQQDEWMDEEQRDAMLRDYQGLVAQTTELALRLLLQQPPNIPTLQTSDDKPHPETIPTRDDIVTLYVNFQRQTLRARVKPTVAKLIQERKRGSMTQPSDNNQTNTGQHRQVQVYDENAPSEEFSNNNNENKTNVISPPSYEKHHANALAVILGQAAALMNPLLAWQLNLPPLEAMPGEFKKREEDDDDNSAPTYNVGQKSSPQELLLQTDPVGLALAQLCHDSLQILDEQAQQLTRTVLEWLYEDREIQEHIQQSNNSEPSKNGGSEPSHNELGFLDGLVEEMALVCLLLAQYQTLTASSQSTSTTTNNTKSTTSPPTSGGTTLSTSLREWTWNYAALERYLAVQQWRTALSLAQPVQIVIHTQIYVPSVVEDAQYLSTRALERAASTQALEAIGTVAHAIAHDVWSSSEASSMDQEENAKTVLVPGVQQALLEERGCWMEPGNNQEEKDETQQKSTMKRDQEKKASNSFASALLDALDGDMGGPPAASLPKAPTSNNNRTPPRVSSKPSSGNFLSALTTKLSAGPGAETMRLMQMQAKFCALNGLGAAATACRSLVESLDASIAEQQQQQHDGSDPPKESPPTSETSQSAADTKAMSMIQLVREELVRFASTYETTQQNKISELIQEYATVARHCDEGPVLHGHGLCLDHIGAFVAHENYGIRDAAALQRLDADDRLETELMAPLKAYVFLQQMPLRCEFQVLIRVAQHLASRVADVILGGLWLTTQDGGSKSFTDWGSLLLSKEVRLIQTHLQECLTPKSEEGDDDGEVTEQAVLLAGAVASKWERLTQAVDILQMEQPSEWLMYRGKNSVLSSEEVAKTMKLRMDFSVDAIAAVTHSSIETKH